MLESPRRIDSMTAGNDRHPPISDYALISDCHCTALVAYRGSVAGDCMPCVDSDSYCGRLLGWDKGGYCALAPAGAFRSAWRYLPGTLVLETAFRSETGAVRLTDFMTKEGKSAGEPLHMTTCASATTLPGRSRWTSTANCRKWLGTGMPAVIRPSRITGTFCAIWSSWRAGAGAGRTKASGRCRERRATMHIPRSGAAPRSFAPLATDKGFEVPRKRWRALRDEMRAVNEHGAFGPKRNGFVQGFGTSALDAATSLLPRVDFLAPDDSRVMGTVDAICQEMQRDGLLMRDTSDDRLREEERGVLSCTFWLVTCFARQGRHEPARHFYARALACANDLDFFSEEYDVDGRIVLGNFPQGLAHGSQITACLAPREDRAGV